MLSSKREHLLARVEELVGGLSEGRWTEKVKVAEGACRVAECAVVDAVVWELLDVVCEEVSCYFLICHDLQFKNEYVHMGRLSL